MKLGTLLVVSVRSSHYRGGTFSFRDYYWGPTDELTITHVQNWRTGLDGFSPSKCEVGKESDKFTINSIVNVVNDHAFSIPWKYRAGFVSETFKYCYGSSEKTIVKPTKPFDISFSECCWVGLTLDNGSAVSSANMFLQAKVHQAAFTNGKLKNNSPSIANPAMWEIFKAHEDCGDQYLELSPRDIDYNDHVRCRWATEEEAKEIYGHHKHRNQGIGWQYNSQWPSLQLHYSHCLLKYTPSKDDSGHGSLKGIAVIMEDFDQRIQDNWGAPLKNPKSSIPVQFLAKVTDPYFTKAVNEVPSQTRSLSVGNWFADHNDHVDHDFNDHSPRKNGQSREKRHVNPCLQDSIPQFMRPFTSDDHDPHPAFPEKENVYVYTPGYGMPYSSEVMQITPQSERVLVEPEGRFEFYIYADRDVNFHYEKPANIICIRNENEQHADICTVAWNDEPEGYYQQVCFHVSDKSTGRNSERRCITVKRMCEPGFYFNGELTFFGETSTSIGCVDKDECLVRTHNCDSTAVCKNTAGSYSCECEPGFEFNENDECVDINECELDHPDFPCSFNAECSNSIGSFECTCSPGYLGDGSICVESCATFYDSPEDYILRIKAFTTGRAYTYVI